MIQYLDQHPKLFGFMSTTFLCRTLVPSFVRPKTLQKGCFDFHQNIHVCNDDMWSWLWFPSPWLEETNCYSWPHYMLNAPGGVRCGGHYTMPYQHLHPGLAGVNCPDTYYGLLYLTIRNAQFLHFASGLQYNGILNSWVIRYRLFLDTKN